MKNTNLIYLVGTELFLELIPQGSEVETLALILVLLLFFVYREVVE
jgi:hypothetical protein